MVKTLLPPKSTRLERALAECCADIERVDIPIRDIHNPDTCPAHLLPWLAWSVSVDRWDDSWSEAAKRQVIRESWGVHKRKGTISAIRSVVEPMGYLLRVIEWWHVDPPEPRGTFRLDIGVNDRGITEATYAELERLIDDAKPVSRHLTQLGIQLETRGHLYTAGSVSTGDTLTVYPLDPSDIISTGYLHTGTCSWSTEFLTVYPIGLLPEGYGDIESPAYLYSGGGEYTTDIMSVHP